MPPFMCRTTRERVHCLFTQVFICHRYVCYDSFGQFLIIRLYLIMYVVKEWWFVTKPVNNIGTNTMNYWHEKEIVKGKWTMLSWNQQFIMNIIIRFNKVQLERVTFSSFILYKSPFYDSLLTTNQYCWFITIPLHT